MIIVQYIYFLFREDVIVFVIIIFGQENGWFTIV